MMIQKRKPIRSNKVRKAANGEACTLNGPHCNYNPETTVFCHLNESFAGKGISQKADDIGFFGCYNCHTDYDQGKLDDKYFYILRAVVRTWQRLIELDILKLAG